jgi:hypothetical protein
MHAMPADALLVQKHVQRLNAQRSRCHTCERYQPSAPCGPLAAAVAELEHAPHSVPHLQPALVLQTPISLFCGEAWLLCLYAKSANLSALQG